jgi:copper chaperone CopZ
MHARLVMFVHTLFAMLKNYRLFTALFLCWIASSFAHAQITQAQLQVSGLTCSMCSFATQKQLQTLPFLDSIGTDLDHTSYKLYFKKGSTVDIDHIKKKVEDAGFSVESLSATMHFSDLKIENNTHYEFEKNLYHFMNVTPQTLNGDVVVKLIDKGFISEKEHKKYVSSKPLPCYITGKMPDINRVYHVTLAKR